MKKNDDPLHGISTFDILHIRRHLLNIDVLDSPYKIIAADANGSNSVSTIDIVLIRRLILNIVDTFTNNVPWRFINSDFTFTNPANPFEGPFPEFRSVNNLMFDQPNFNFIAVKTGDVTEDVNFSLTDSGVVRSISNRPGVVVKDQFLKQGTHIQIPIAIQDINKMVACQFTLYANPDKAEILDISEGDIGLDLKEQTSMHQAHNGYVTAMWENPTQEHYESNHTAFYITIRILEDGWLSDVLQINSDLTPAFGFDIDGRVWPINLNYTTTGLVNGNIRIEVYPNPFLDYFEMDVFSPYRKKVKLMIRDITGQLIYTNSQEVQPGINNIVIHELSDIKSGVYTVELRYGDQRQIQKLIKLH